MGLAVAVVLILNGAGTASACETGHVQSATGYVAGALGDGVIVGIGVAVSALITARFARRSQWLLAVVLGAGLNFIASAGAYALFYTVVTGSCTSV
jgi:hypothetical protein